MLPLTRLSDGSGSGSTRASARLRAARRAAAKGQRTPVASSHTRHRRVAISSLRVIFDGFATFGAPRATKRGPMNAPPSTSGSASARTSGHAPCSFDWVISACRLSANRVAFVGSFTPTIPAVRPLVE